MEMELIARLQTQNPLFGYNICAGGEGVTGWHPSEETRNKLSLSARRRVGAKNPNYGHRWTDEMKASARQRKVSEETRQKISKAAKERTGEANPFYGKHHSAATKEKLAGLRRRAVEMFGKEMILLECFPSIKCAAERTGINSVAISNCCRGVTKTAGGYIWRYANNCDL